MTRDDPDDQLAFLLRDSVVDVEPSERLGELRARTATTSSRRWWTVAGGAALAAAAAVTVIAVLGSEPAPTVDPGPADPPPRAAPPRAVPAYFVGDTPRGPRLYREFQPVSSPAPGLAGLGLLESGPLDPDYTSLWPSGSFGAVSDPQSGIVEVRLTDAAPADPSDLALQQVVYTVSAGFQEPLTVALLRGDTVGEEVSASPQLEVLSLVSLSDPGEGQVVGDTLRVRGVANSNEANILWGIESASGSAGMGSSFTAEGWMGARLFAFSGRIDVSSLDPGTYTLTVETDDPSGGAEGLGPFSDTRTFVIE
ncbi:MAG: Gmad2 immunoglobulin-like domain-containing protein [Nocardioides sp.]